MNSGYCSLVIKGFDLNFNEIEEILATEASQKFINGEVISEVLGRNKFDLIRFDNAIEDIHTVNQTLDKILDLIIAHELYVKTMQKKYDVFLKCFIQSDGAQVNYRISSDIMRKIVDMDVDLEISVLSWGGVE